MNAIQRGVKAAYNFFAGDMIILSLVVFAFAFGLFLGQVVHASTVVLATVFIVLIVLALTLTLAREVRGRPRVR